MGVPQNRSSDSREGGERGGGERRGGGYDNSFLLATLKTIDGRNFDTIQCMKSVSQQVHLGVVRCDHSDFSFYNS